MNKFESINKPLKWSIALMIVAAAAGCGGSGEGTLGANPNFGTTGSVCTGANCVDLGAAANYVILAEAGVTYTPTATVTPDRKITGNIGISPAAASFITGFALNLPAGGAYSTSTLVAGNVYAPGYAPPTPSNLTTAVANKLAAYNAAAGKPAGVGANLNLLAGVIPSGHDFAPGTYTWNSGTPSGNVGMTGNITLTGGPNDVWIFQISGNLNLATDTNITLVGALPQNVFWQVAGTVSIGTGAHMEGVILSASNIALTTNATVKGRLLSKTEVTMDANTVTQP